MGAVDILRLKPAFNDEQAEALARLIDENIATKRDIADVHRSIEELRTELKRDIAEVEHRIEALRKELTDAIDSRAKDLRLEIENVRLEIERLRGEMEKGRNDLTRWIVGFGIAIIALMVALRLFG
jgi:chromosome segregation ATPase